MIHDTHSISKKFKNFFSNLAESLLIKFLKPSYKYNLISGIQYYSSFVFTAGFVWLALLKKIIQDIKRCKAVGVHKFSGKFLKVGLDILAKPVSTLCNLSVYRGVFPDACKVAKLKPIFQNGKKLIHQATDQFLRSLER